MEESVSSLALSSFHMLLISFLPPTTLHELILFIYLFGSAAIHLLRPRCFLLVLCQLRSLDLWYFTVRWRFTWASRLLLILEVDKQGKAGLSAPNLATAAKTAPGGQPWADYHTDWVSAHIYIVLGFIYCKYISSVCTEVMSHMAARAFKVHICIR